MRESMVIAGKAMDIALERMDVISNNLANVSTSAYKKDMIYSSSFKDMMTRQIATGEVPEIPKGNIVVTDFEAGNFRFTGEKMNAAIDGDGFYKIQLADGSFGYTRAGEFSINAEKQLTIHGRVVMGDGGSITLEDTEITMDSKGVIYNRKGDRQASLLLVNFEQPYPLEKAGGTLFIAKENAEELPSTAEIKQQYIEESNVSALSAMVEMINLMDVMRQYETQQKMIQYQDDATERMITQLTQG